MHASVRSDVTWVLRYQALAVAAVSLAAGGLSGLTAAVSAFAGGAIGILGALAYVWRAFVGASGETDLRKLYRAQMLGETYKYAVILGGFALVFLWFREVAALPLFLGFATTVVIYWMALLKTRN